MIISTGRNQRKTELWDMAVFWWGPPGGGHIMGGPWGAHEKKSRTGAPKKFFPAMGETRATKFWLKKLRGGINHTYLSKKF